MHSTTLWNDRCAAAHALGEDIPDYSRARSRQAVQLRVETAYAHAHLMLVTDRSVLEVPLKERYSKERFRADKIFGERATE
jgi:hypothetical protein